MSGSQSRNDVSLSETTDPETEVLCSEDLKAHIDHFNRHANDIAKHIDRLMAEGRGALEELQRRFVGRLESLKDDLMSGVQSQNAQWDDSLKKAGDDLEYLLSIKKFVKSLGLAIEK